MTEKQKGILKADMLNESSIWVNKRTKNNIDIIYDFLETKSEEYRKKGRFYRPTYSEISRETKIHNDQVRTACWILAFKKYPLVKLIRTVIPDGAIARCGIQVQFILESNPEIELNKNNH